MKNCYFFMACTSVVFSCISLSTAAALKETKIPQTGTETSDQSGQSGCVAYKINPKRLYAPFKVRVFSGNFTREFLFEDTSDAVFDQSVFDTNVSADSTVTLNYIDRHGQVVPGETEVGHSSGNQSDCRKQMTLNFGLKATAGSFEYTPNTFSARSYYEAIDRYDKKTTLKDWKRENGFPEVNSPLTESTLSTNPMPNGPLSNDVSGRRGKGSSRKNQGPNSARKRVLKAVQEGGSNEETSAIYFNHGDLGFGRNMHMIHNGKRKKNLAFYVTNYRSLEDAIAQNNPIATVAMEYSFGSKRGKNKERYIQFYAFGDDGGRIPTADLDGRGEKAIPGLCVTCHGAVLVAGEPGEKVLPEEVPEAGDIGARFLPFDLEAFDFSDTNETYSRAAQETAFKTMNLALLNAFPTKAMTELIEGWYASSSSSLVSQRPVNGQGQRNREMKSAKARTQSSAGIEAQSESNEDGPVVSESRPILSRTTQHSAFVPNGWRGDHEELYTEIVAPYCRGCHITRGASLDWTTYTAFSFFDNIIKNKVCREDSKTMPNAKATYQNMWLSAVDPIDVLERHGIFTLGANEACGQGPWAR